MKKLAKYIDHTNLKADATAKDIAKLCREAKKYGFASVCVNPAEVATAKKLLRRSEVKVCTVIGFPLGANTTDVKTYEAVDAIGNGADELDFVVNVRLLKYAPDECLSELYTLASVCKGARPDLCLKLILECCYLTDAEKRRGCRLAKKAGFDFVKTSTGFGSGGATVHDVKLLRKTVGPSMGVKAAGGIRTRAAAEALLAAGATRLGCSAGVAIVDRSFRDPSVRRFPKIPR